MSNFSPKFSPEIQPRTQEVVEVTGFDFGNNTGEVSILDIYNGSGGHLGELTVFDVLTQMPIPEKAREEIFGQYERLTDSYREELEEAHLVKGGATGPNDEQPDFEWPLILRDPASGGLFRLITPLEMPFPKPDDPNSDGPEYYPLSDLTMLVLIDGDEKSQVFDANRKKQWDEISFLNEWLRKRAQEDSGAVTETTVPSINLSPTFTEPNSNEISEVRLSTILDVQDQPHAVNIGETFFVNVIGRIVGHEVYLELFEDDGENDVTVQAINIGLSAEVSEVKDRVTYGELAGVATAGMLNEILDRVQKNIDDKEKVKEILLEAGKFLELGTS